jgi:hypothetical protein
LSSFAAGGGPAFVFASAFVFACCHASTFLFVILSEAKNPRILLLLLLLPLPLQLRLQFFLSFRSAAKESASAVALISLFVIP